MKTKKCKIDCYEGFFRGQILDNQDPEQLGRLKVNVFGVFDDIPSEHLPWAVPAMPVHTGSGSDSGYFSVPAVDSFVWCFFESSDFYQPVYFAEALDGVHGLPSERTTNYPNRRVLKTTSGITIIIDDTSQLVKLNHPSGAFISIDSAGLITISGTEANIDTTGPITISGSQVNINP